MGYFTKTNLITNRIRNIRDDRNAVKETGQEVVVIIQSWNDEGLH